MITNDFFENIKRFKIFINLFFKNIKIENRINFGSHQANHFFLEKLKNLITILNTVQVHQH